MQQVFDLDAAKSKARDVSLSLRRSRAWPYLKEADRTVLELVEKGLSHRLIGQAVGLNAGTVSRRVAMIRTRLQTPLARCALDPTTPLPAAHREVAIQHAVAGLSLREIARVHRTSLAAVAEQVHYALGVTRGIGSRRAAGGE